MNQLKTYLYIFCIIGTEVSLPAEVSANVSESTSIDCTVNSSQHVNITWMKDGDPLIAENNREIIQTFQNKIPVSLVSTSTISFTTVQPSDSGWYECMVAGKSDESALLNSTSVYLNILQKDLIATQFATSTATGNTATTRTTTGRTATTHIDNATNATTTSGIVVTESK